MNFEDSFSTINLPSSCSIFSIDGDKKPLEREEIREEMVESGLMELEGEPLLVVINDGHRSTPSGKILDILSEIKRLQIKEIIIATGSHPPPTKKEMYQITKGVENKIGAKLLVHDCDAEDLEEFGNTSKGTKIILNPIIRRYSNILTINSVEPHFFAGFTGGVKSIVPGLAARETIVRNHSWAMHPRAMPGEIEGNPLQNDLQEGFAMVTDSGISVYSIQLVSHGDKIYQLSSGKLLDAFHTAVEYANQVYVKNVSQKFDVIVSFVSHPLNRSLYQAQKGLENTRGVLRKGGIMILVAECWEGVGNDAFYKTMIKYDTDEILDTLDRENYSFGDHKAYKFASLTKDNTVYITSKLDLDIIHNISLRYMSFLDLEHFLLDCSRNNKSIAVVLNAGMLTLRNVEQVS